MSESNFFYDISEENVASWIDGTMTPEQEAEFMQGLAEDSDLTEILDSLDDVEASFETLIEDGYELPEEIMYGDFELPDVAMPEDVDMFNDDIDDDIEAHVEDHIDAHIDAQEHSDSESDEEVSFDDTYNAEQDSDGSNHYGHYSTQYAAEHEDEDALDGEGYNEVGHDIDDDSSSMGDDGFDMMF